VSNKLWLRASDIGGIADGSVLNIPWNDASGNSNDASQTNPSYQPVYLSAGLNSRPAIQFNGINSLLDDARSYDAKTVFVVYSVDPSLQGEDDLGQVWGNYEEGVHVAMDPRSGNQNGFSFDGRPIGVTKARYALNGKSYGIFDYDANYYQWTYDAAELIGAEFETIQSLTRQVIGSLFSSHFAVGEHQFGGEISEIIVYNSALNDAQKIIVENYLSSYYSIDISGGGNDHYSFEASHPYDVSGIGRVSLTDQHDTAFSAGIVGIADPDDLDTDGEFLFFGHDNNIMCTYKNTTCGYSVTGSAGTPGFHTEPYHRFTGSK